MRRLVDDALSTRPFSTMFYILAGSGQIEGRHISRERHVRRVATIVRFLTVFACGVWVGWMAWGVR